MKLYILSDIHIDFSAFNPPNLDADVVILAGDIHIKQHGLEWAIEAFSNIPVMYVLGNHEYYGKALPKHLHKLKEKAKGTNIHILEDESVTISDTTFVCCTLWTDFELLGDPRIAGYEATQIMTDYKKIRVNPTYRKLRSIDTVGIHYHSKNWLKAEFKKRKGEKLVVVTHHAPSMKSLPKAFQKDPTSSAYASHLDALVESSGARLWVHGHIHTQQNYMIGETQVICNPRGYPDEPNIHFVEDLVLEV